MRPRYGTSYWLHRVPKSRQPVYPRHRGHLDVDVAIVGGGLTGAMTAYGFAAAGVKVAVLEAGRVGQGSTAGSPGLALTGMQAEFRDLVERYGLRAARRIAQAMRRASLDASATLRRLKIRCDLTPVDALHVAVGADAARALRRELDAEREAGLEATWQTAAAIRREARLDSAGGLRVRGNARFDPYRATLGLMAAASGRGAVVFENTNVERARPGRKAVDIRTAGGTLRATSIVIAAGSPTADLKPLRRHFQRAASYCVLTAPLPAAVRRAVAPPDLVLRDSSTPAHYVRWVGDDRLLVSGADQPQTGARARDRVLVQRTGQLMYELSLLYPAISGIPAEYGWDYEIATPVDRIPCLGPHRNYPRYLFALGAGHNGAGVAWLASRILLRHYSGAPAKGDELFAFARLLGR
jgi:glycine/D-amino acid oxidase-like deaminating enzyme